MDNTCSVDGCDKQKRARGYCPGHYNAAKARGEFSGDPCSEEGCTRTQYSLGMCNPHYQRLRRNNPTPDALIKEAQGCSVEGCDRPHKTVGYCHMHYERLRTRGSVGGPDRITQPAGSWYVVNGYMRRKEGGVVILQHREVMSEVVGRPLESHETVHHINGDKLDNRPENLQLRSGRHGKGVVHKCLDCGSTNIVSEAL